jgi:hypothetical protein
MVVGKLAPMQPMTGSFRMPRDLVGFNRMDNMIHMPGTSYHWGKPARDYNRVKYFRAQYKDWPPKDASPMHPIEPWGKTFFVHNFRPDVEWMNDKRAPGWHDIRGEWWQDDLYAGLSQGRGPAPETAANETKLCVTDFRRRPYLFFSRAELEHFLSEIPALKAKLAEYELANENNKTEDDFDLFEAQRAVMPDKYSEKQRGKVQVGGKHTTYPIWKQPERRHVTSYELKDKRKKAARMAYQEALAREEAEQAGEIGEQRRYDPIDNADRRLKIYKTINNRRTKFTRRF